MNQQLKFEFTHPEMIAAFAGVLTKYFDDKILTYKKQKSPEGSIFTVTFIAPTYQGKNSIYKFGYDTGLAFSQI